MSKNSDLPGEILEDIDEFADWGNETGSEIDPDKKSGVTVLFESISKTGDIQAFFGDIRSPEFTPLTSMLDALASLAFVGDKNAVDGLVSHWNIIIRSLLKAPWRNSTVEETIITSIHNWYPSVSSSQLMSVSLQHHICEVPFAPSVIALGPGEGIVVEAINVVGSYLAGFPNIDPGLSSKNPGPPPSHKLDLSRFRALAERALHNYELPLERVQRLFGLSTEEIANLFGVSRQAVEAWMRNGEVPQKRREKLGNLLEIGELLDRKLKPGRLALAARKPADAYSGLTMLEMVKDDRDRELLELTRRSFDWSGAA